MKKTKLIKTITLGLAGLIGLGAVIGAIHAESKQPEVAQAADEELIAKLDSSDVANMSVGQTSYTNSYGTWNINPSIGGIPDEKDCFSILLADTGGSGVGGEVSIDTGRENLTRMEITCSGFKLIPGDYKVRFFLWRGKNGGKSGEYYYKCVSNDVPATATTYTFNFSDMEVPSVDKGKVTFNFDRLEKKTTIAAYYSIKIWAAPLCDNVTLDRQGGSGGTGSIEAYPGQALPDISVPSRTGYTFGGYYTGTSGGGTQYYTSAGKSANNWTKGAASTLYAKWTANTYTVRYNANKPSNATGEVANVPGNATWTYDSNATLGNAPSLTGWTFGGWYKEAACTNKLGNANQTLTKPNLRTTAGIYDIYAKWTANTYTVKYNANKPTDATGEVSGVPADANWTYDNNATLGGAPSLPGWTFGGWYKEAACTNKLGNAGANVTKPNLRSTSGTANIYAKWIPNTYTARYMANKPVKAPTEVTDVPADATWTYDSPTKVTLGAAPKLTGYVFKGWYKEAACSNLIGNAGAQILKPNLTTTKDGVAYLYAKWAFDPAIQAVVDKINGTKTCGYDNLTDQIEDADSSYSALSLAFQAVVDAEGYTHILDNAKAADAAGQMIEDLGPAQDTEEWRQAVIAARNAYDDLEDKSYIPADTILVILTDDEAAVVVMDIINDIGDPHWTSESRDLIDDAEDAYAAYIAASHPAEKIANIDTLHYADECYDNVQQFVDKVNAITANPFEYTPECKALIDDARNYFESLDEYQQGLCTSDAKTYYDLLVNYENAYEASRLIDAIGTMKNTDACKEKIEAARAAIDALNETTELPLISDELLKLLVDKEAGWSVIEKINAIYPMVYGEGCEKAIETARNAFDALEDDQEQYVVNYELLLKAEEDYAAVKKVVEEVAALGDIRHDEESLKKIEHARAEYNALTPDQKALYPHDSLEDIVDYETAYKALDYIYNIGDVNYDTDSQEKIEEARAFYDSLSDEQKELIHISDLEVLTKSEVHYGELKKKADIFVIIMLIVACLAVVGGGLFIFFLLKRRKKDDEEENQPAKAMSVAGVLPIVALISHYVDAPYVALYVIAGVALLVWVAALVLVILKKKQVLFFKPQEVTGGAIESPEEEVKVVTDEKGNVFQIRYLKSFSAKLIQASDEAKNNYTILKNHVLAYKGLASRVSWRFDTINSEKGVVLKFVVRGKTLCVYYNLNADEVDSKYKVEKVESKRFADVPCLYRIKNARRLEYAKELIDLLMRKLHVKKGKDQHEDYYLPYEETEALVKKGLVKEINGSSEKSVGALEEEFLASISAEEADEKMSDEVAESKIEENKTVVPHLGKKGIINIDDLEANFESGDTITLEVLLEKKLVPSDVKRVKLLARGKLDKKFHVELQDYSLQAVKMVLLVGGSVKRV